MFTHTHTAWASTRPSLLFLFILLELDEMAYTAISWRLSLPFSVLAYWFLPPRCTPKRRGDLSARAPQREEKRSFILLARCHFLPWAPKKKPSPCFLSRSPSLEHLTPPLYPSLVRSLHLSHARQVRQRRSRGRWGNNLSLPRLVRFSAHGHHTAFASVRKLQLHVKLAFSWWSSHIGGVIRRRHSNSRAIFNTPACLSRHPKWQSLNVFPQKTFHFCLFKNLIEGLFL